MYSIEDNSKAEEYALLAFVCQWICANKRRLYRRHSLRCDGAGFYQLRSWEYSVSRENSPMFCRGGRKPLAAVENRPDNAG
ncbi:DUF2575 domain-containing protein [Serratia marcescens subsp. marcescens ATCC 13880]|nr:DUF2575 domain-containing protein [Serratia marcescens subsp. marcescens ATCC 13880]RTF22638.1 DUF2575 domain-containing protein [Serratia marcescens subsp. marcescens ATCC 13880]